MDMPREIHRVAVESAIQLRIIKDNDLALVPEAYAPLGRMAEAISKDLFEYHREIQKQLQFPLFQKAYCYMFGKGMEAAYQWHNSEGGEVNLGYNFSDLLQGLVGAGVSGDFQGIINAVIPILQESFCDLQDWLITNISEISEQPNGVVDSVIYSLKNSALIGLHFGLNRVGYP